MGRRSRHVVDAPGADASGSPGMLTIVDLAGLALIAIRWFTPTEGTFRGDTLWISQLWLGWGVLAAWSAMRQADRWTRRGGPWCWGLLLLVLGHVVSGLVVVATEGQKRAALNGLWEWVSLGLAAVWFHHRASSESFRRTFRIALVASAVGLSVLGIWQRWVTQPELGRAVIQLDELEAAIPSLEGAERRRAESQLRALRRTVGPEYTSLDSAGRRAMRQRLIESTEPLGRFALANSLAAILLVGILLVAGDALTLWRRAELVTESTRNSRVASRAGLAVIALLLTFVLLLTKSRTAWAGAIGGAAIAVVLGFRGRLRSALFWGALGSGAMGVLVLVTWAAGGLDRLVVTEAPKSLEYRTEYWIGTWKVIQDHPLIGIGPGNFRQHYLGHKLAKSSEEVLDPHNFLLESWVTGGLIAFAGLIAIITGSLAVCRRGVEPAASSSDPVGWRSSAPAIVLIAVATLLCQQWLLEGFADGELALIGGLSVLSAIGLNRIIPATGADRSTEIATRAAWCALSVHLLGAGGMEMPAIIQLWLCLSSLIVARQAAMATADQRSWPAWMPGAAIATCGLAFFGQLATATAPSITSRALSNLADAEALAGSRPDRIDERLADAAVSDRFDPDPWRRRAQFAFRQWSQSRAGEWFDRAVEYQQEAIARDPRHAHDRRALAQLHLDRFAIDNRPADAEAAVTAMHEALKLYPNHVAGRRLLTDALSAAGRMAEATDAAWSTLELDALFLNLGHYDKTLTPGERVRMNELTKPK